MKQLLYLKDEQLKEFIEKLFIGYRESFSDPKKILANYSIGIAHHKVIHLVSLYQGITITELLKKFNGSQFKIEVLKRWIAKEASIKWQRGKLSEDFRKWEINQEKDFAMHQCKP